MSNRLIDSLCAIAGVRPDARRRAPHARAQAATLGVLLLLTAFISAFTSSFAISQIFLGNSYAGVLAVCGGLTWAALVLCIDRLMIMGLDRFASAGRQLVHVLLRLPLAIVIAAVMSKPVLLRICEPVIEEDLRKQQRSSLDAESVANAKEARVSEREQDVDDWQGQRKTQRGRLAGEPDSSRYKTARRVRQDADAERTATRARLLPRIGDATAEIARIEAERPAQETTAAERAARATRLRTRIGAWNNEIKRVDAARDQATTEVTAARDEWVVAETALLGEADREHATAVAAARIASETVATRNADARDTLSRILSLNLVNRYRTLRRITSDAKHPDAAAIRVFELALDALFLCLELTPLLLKALGRKTPLDSATVAVEFEDTERINLGANRTVGQDQKSTEAALDVYDKAVDAWRQSHVQRFQATPPTTTDLVNLRVELNELVA